MKSIMTFVAVIFLIGLPTAVFAAENEGNSKKPLPPPAKPGPENINTYIHLLVDNLEKAQPPLIEDRKLILTWKADYLPRSVSAAFRFEHFRQKHVFWRNQNGVYFLVMDLTPDMPMTLDYRLIVDGLWEADPTNPQSVQDAQGVVVSQISLTSTDKPMVDGPVQRPLGQVDFVYRGKPGQTVSIMGNFNQWDPFADYLTETSPGEYRASLTLPPGTVLYRFVIGTKSVLDPGNAHTGTDDQGGTFSFFQNQKIQPTTILAASLPQNSSY